MTYQIALAGNPNSGKTTLFNMLTGSKSHVGNWSGVTVERKTGKYIDKKNDIENDIIDLPGIYSLSPYSEEEVITRDFLFNGDVDIIINIVDATNLERNLYLTSQIISTGIPTVIALNMIDEVEKNGDKINIKAMQEELKTPVIAISATRNIGIEALMKIVQVKATESKNKKREPITLLSRSKAYTYIEKIRKILSDSSNDTSFFVAEKILEQDEKIFDMLDLPLDKIKHIKELVIESKKTIPNSEWDIEIADAKYKYIEKICKKVILRSDSYSYTQEKLSDKIDKVVTHRLLAIPLFLLVMFFVFQFTFGGLGAILTDFMDVFIHETFTTFITNTLIYFDASEWTISLIVDGIITGVGMVVVFLPQILLLMLFLSIMEDTGYMARAAFVMDRLLRSFGLSGKSFVPMLMGFGCSVPAIMATRTLENEKDRRMTIILTPFMSCGAKMPVYLAFAGALFAENQGVVIFSLYLIGIVVAIISGIILQKTVLQGDPAPFIMELPPYRIPTANSVFTHMWEKTKDFAYRAGTILLAAAIVIWTLQTFNFSLRMVEDNSQSMLGIIGTIIAPIFEPLGFGDWRSSVALLTGFIAKEAVVGTLGILYGIGEITEVTESLTTALSAVYTPLSAFSYMVFVLLYLPCVVAFVTTKKEMNSWKWTFFAAGYQTSIAWIMAFLVYQIGTLLGL